MRTGLLLSRLLSSCSLGFRGYGSEFRCAARYRGLSYSRHFSFGFSGIDIDVYIYIHIYILQSRTKHYSHTAPKAFQNELRRRPKLAREAQLWTSTGRWAADSEGKTWRSGGSKGRKPFLGGSWVVISMVVSRIILVITYVRGLKTPLITTHEPPSRAQAPYALPAAL